MVYNLLEYSFLFCLDHILLSISLVMEKFVLPGEEGPISYSHYVAMLGDNRTKTNRQTNKQISISNLSGQI